MSKQTGCVTMERNGVGNKLFQVVVSLLLLSGGGTVTFVVLRQNDNVDRVGRLETVTEVLKAQRDSMDEAFTRIDVRLLGLENKIDARLSRIEDKLDGVRERMSTLVGKPIASDWTPKP